MNISLHLNHMIIAQYFFKIINNTFGIQTGNKTNIRIKTHKSEIK